MKQHQIPTRVALLLALCVAAPVSAQQQGPDYECGETMVELDRDLRVIAQRVAPPNTVGKKTSPSAAELPLASVIVEILDLDTLNTHLRCLGSLQADRN